MVIWFMMKPTMDLSIKDLESIDLEYLLNLMPRYWT